MRTLALIGLLVVLAAPAARADSTIYLAFDGFTGTYDGTQYVVPTFNASNLDANFTAQDEADIEDRVYNIVWDAFTDFRVAIRLYSPAPENHMAIGIGSDANGNLYGWVPSIDSNPNDMDFARVWAGSYKQYEAFQGFFSTVERWGNAIGETAAHEAGHNYGLDHWHANPTPGEQALGVLASDHLMSTGATVTPWQHAAGGRIFGDRSYGVLAATLGLKQTLLWNGSWVNHNNVAAHQLCIEVLTTEESPTLQEWNGLNPFDTCTVTAMGTEQFGGKTYYKHKVAFSGGQVPSRVLDHHVGQFRGAVDDLARPQPVPADRMAGQGCVFHGRQRRAAGRSPAKHIDP